MLPDQRDPTLFFPRREEAAEVNTQADVSDLESTLNSLGIVGRNLWQENHPGGTPLGLELAFWTP